MEDERQEELDCITAIFPEIRIDNGNQYCATIDLTVKPIRPVKVSFPIAADRKLPTPPLSEVSDDAATERTEETTDLHDLSYLPSLRLRITLPEGYPENTAPKFSLSTDPSWLNEHEINELEQNGRRLWEEGGKCQVVFGYIDSLQQAAENAFGYAENGRILEIAQDLKLSLLDHDVRASQAAFDKETFACGICLDPKKGSSCYRMIDCGHVFCVQCLQDFYNNAITEGDISSIRCLTPGCSKRRGEAQLAKKRRGKPKIQLSPSELLQIPLGHEVVKRYVQLKYKAQLESDKNTVYCPRKWCQGAAKSKKYHKPEGFEDDKSDDEGSDGEQTERPTYIERKDRIAICEDCSYAFCSRCFQGWHGELYSCLPRKSDEEMTAEEKASMEYMQLHTTPCPTCAAPAQKTHGCNHMICFRCNSHFCYLCSAWLSPGNPYQHFNQPHTGCFQRLWELEGGDGDDVDVGYAGGRRLPPEPELDPEQVFAALEEALEVVERREPDLPPPPQPALQREGPLVLRINHVPPPAIVEAAAPPRRNAQVRNNRRRGAAVQQDRPAPGPRAQRRARAAAREQARDQFVQGADDQEAAQQAWVRMFVHMALNDQEDELDSDEEADPAAWEIPAR